MSFDINMYIIYNVHLSTEMEGKKHTKCLKAHLKILTKLLLYCNIGCQVHLVK